MTEHVVVIGYGRTGRHAANSALASSSCARLTVLDLNWLAVAEAPANGATAFHADGRDEGDLRVARVEQADRVIVAVPEDPDALLIATAVRYLNPEVVVVAAIRETANHALFDRMGVHSVHIGRDQDETR